MALGTIQSNHLVNGTNGHDSYATSNNILSLVNNNFSNLFLQYSPQINIYTGTLNANNWTETNDYLITSNTYLPHQNQWYLSYQNSGGTYNDSYYETMTEETMPNHKYFSLIPYYENNPYYQFYYGARWYRFRTYLYTPEPKEITFTYYNGQTGAIALDDTIILHNSGGTQASGSLNLHAGFNKIVLFSLAASKYNDKFIVTPLFYEMDGIIQIADLLPSYEQIITPTKIQGENLSSSIMLSQPIVSNDSFQYYSNSTIYNNSSIKVQLGNGYKPEENITCYWIGYSKT